jgi:hypothetical protein
VYDSLSKGPKWDDGIDVKYKCFKYYGLVGSDKLTCSDGDWIGTTPKCEYNQETESKYTL